MAMNRGTAKPGRWWRCGWRLTVGLSVVYLLLLIPESPPQLDGRPPGVPFAWNQDLFWKEMESRFVAARGTPPEELARHIDSGLKRISDTVAVLETQRRLPASDERFALLETNLFEVAPWLAANPGRLPDFLRLVTRMRHAVKEQSIAWDLEQLADRQRLYRLLYGSRAALEEILLQSPADVVPPLLVEEGQDSPTPVAKWMHLRLHSGDILVSRGGAPTSALIARGNDYPGNFSHVALVHIDPGGTVSVIESHIERGVAITTLERYLAEKKLRLIVLRLRPDLPASVANPQLPHEVATAALHGARQKHIPYDFTMNYHDESAMFCTEVATAAYRSRGVRLWTGLSHLSGSGVRSWLSAFGVRHFETQEPSDLEYDPQLVIVAEWRDPQTLFEDHVDNAITDARLLQADRGARLPYSRPMLPIARLTKFYSVVKNGFGLEGPIPEGMNATAALRSRRLIEDHQVIKQKVLHEVDTFRKSRGYVPPFWELVAIAQRLVEAKH